VSPRRRGRIGLLSLVAILFFNVSGGPYGLEDAVGTLGPGLVLVLLVVTPLVWSLPVSLAMAELAAAMPEEGGYVVWVHRAFGRFWGFQVGWWSWINSFVDVAVYPALFADYVGFWRPDMSALERWALHRGLTREQVMAIGDNYNDVEMLEFAGRPVIMGNAAEELKQNGWAVTLSNAESGVAAAVEEALAP